MCITVSPRDHTVTPAFFVRERRKLTAATLSGGTRGVLSVLATAFFFGSAAPFTKLLLTSFAPVTLASLLYMGDGLFFTTFCLVRLKFLTKNHICEAPVERRDISWIAGAE
jgi:hypothetical protein